MIQETLVSFSFTSSHLQLSGAGWTWKVRNRGLNPEDNQARLGSLTQGLKSLQASCPWNGFRPFFGSSSANAVS